MFASFQFEAVHHQLKQSTVDYDPGATLDADDEGMEHLVILCKTLSQYICFETVKILFL